MIAGVRNPLIIEDDDRVDGVDYRAVDAEDWDSMDELFAGIGSDDIELVGAALLCRLHFAQTGTLNPY